MPRIRLDPTSRLPIEPQVPPVLASLIEEPAPPIPEPTEYVELWARSSFSFLQAASLPEELIRVGAELGHGAIGICDRDGLYGIVRGWEECKRTGVRLVVGAEITLSEGPTVLLHVSNHAGYSNLCRILTESHRLHPKGKPRDEEGVPRNLYAGLAVD